MAVSSKSYYANGYNGTPQAVSEVDINSNSENPKFNLGFACVDSVGNVYRYAQFGATISAGELASQDLSESSLVDTDNICAAAAIGATSATITLASTTVDQFKGGMLCITDDAGEGYQYVIKGNTVADASNLVILSLESPLKVALTTASDIAIIGNRYSNLEAATTTDADPVGRATSTVAVAGYFGWVQTKGRGTILQDGTVTVGGILTLSDGVAGAVQALGGGGTTVGALITEPLIGRCVIAGDNTGQCVADFNLE